MERAIPRPEHRRPKSGIHGSGRLTRVRAGASGPCAAAALLLFLLGGQPARAASATFLQGRSVSDLGKRTSLSVGLETQADVSSRSAGGGFFVLDGLLPGTRDRLLLSGSGFENSIGATFFAGVTPALDLELPTVESTSLDRWVDLLNDGTVDGDGTLDVTKGAVFGEVRDSAGNPVAAAVVSVSPDMGTVLYFGAHGDPDPAALMTGTTGRFLVLDVPPGNVSIAASAGAGFAGDGTGASLVGKAYGKVLANTVLGVVLRPPVAVSGSVVNEVGDKVPAALVAWDFDTDFATLADKTGFYSLAGLAQGIDVTLRGTATGYKTSLSFRRSSAEFARCSNHQGLTCVQDSECPDAALGETCGGPAVCSGHRNVACRRDATCPDAPSGETCSGHDLVLLSEAAYADDAAAFHIVQAPSLGMIVGRILTPEGLPLAGASVTVDPAVGTVGYFDEGNPGGMLPPRPDPVLRQTTSSGLFVVFNVPVGNIVLAALGPDQTIRGEVAPSEAGAVTLGDLRGLPRITIKGRLLDEQFRSVTIGGAVVSLVEFPYIATIAAGNGEYTLEGVPAGEMLTTKIERFGFKTTFGFIEKTPLLDLACLPPGANHSCSESVSACAQDADCPNFANGETCRTRRCSAHASTACTKAGDCPDAGTGEQCVASGQCSNHADAVCLRDADCLDAASGERCLPPSSRSSCRDFFLISDTAFANLYLQAGMTANRGLALVSAGVFLSNGNGALGLQAQLTPNTGAVFYQPDQKFGGTSISTVGAVQFFNAGPSVGGFAVFDDRNDEASLRLVRAEADAVTVSDSFRLDCDTNADGTFANLYPCDGARFATQAKDAFFQWNLGANEKGQLQFSTDAAFTTINLTNAPRGGPKFSARNFWFANAKTWKKIKKLGASGTPVYWRILARAADNVESATAPSKFFLP